MNGIRVADTAEGGGTPLVLNGAGMRTWFLFHVYVDALREGITRNTVQQGDLLTIDFLADGTTRLTRNGRPQGAPIAVWIGPNPLQADLKRALLGRGD